MKDLVKLEDSIVYDINDFTNWVSPALVVHTMTLSTHDCEYFSENCESCLQGCFAWNLLFSYTDLPSCDHTFLMQALNIPKKGLCLIIYGKRNISLHSCNQNTHYSQHGICYSKLRCEYNDVFLIGSLHCTMHSIFL